jgi:hypothetical protein
LRAAGASCGEVVLARLVRDIAHCLRSAGSAPHRACRRPPGAELGPSRRAAPQQQPGGRQHYSAAAQAGIKTSVAHDAGPPTLVRRDANIINVDCERRDSTSRRRIRSKLTVVDEAQPSAVVVNDGAISKYGTEGSQ